MYQDPCVASEVLKFLLVWNRIDSTTSTERPTTRLAASKTSKETHETEVVASVSIMISSSRQHEI